jgi:hypothetical protein
MGRLQYTWVHDHFKNVDKPHLKTPRRQCRYCGYETKSDTTRQSTHLKQCMQYQDHLRKQPPRGPIQAMLSPPKTSMQKKDLLDLKFAAAVYEAGHPFTMYEKPAIQEAFQLLDPSYTPPSAKLLGTRLLEEAYMREREEVGRRIASAKYLNFTTDESDSVRRDRIANLSANLLHDGAFHLRSLCTGSTTHSAENLANLVMDELSIWTDGNFERVNSINTDTCSTMRKLHDVLQAKPELEHVFFTLCDSHGLQLLIKDILQIPWFASVVKRISKIVGDFRKSLLQLAILREYQMLEYGKHKAFIIR